MRAILTSLGSMGDVQPLLALAVELARHGHRPVMALSPNYASRIGDLGLEFVPLGPELKRTDIRGVITAQMGMPDLAEQTAHLLNAIMPIVPEMFRGLCALAREATVLISPPHQFASRMAHETTGIPYVSVHLSPFGALGAKSVKAASAPIINRYRAAEGLPPLDDPLTVDAVSSQLALYAVSRRIVRPSAQRPAHHHVTGYFFLDEEGWQPDPELSEFLSAGEPPVGITFSSIVHDNPEAVTDLILEAIRQAGCRAIIQRGWSGLAERRLPETVCAIGFVPHAWLFPRLACVVHHGGAGTTAAAFRAGVPAVIIPHTLDQPLWAEFARGLGCAGAVIPYTRLTAERLAVALTQTLTTPRYRAAAATLAGHIRAEPGVQAARELIEQLIVGRGNGVQA